MSLWVAASAAACPAATPMELAAEAADAAEAAEVGDGVPVVTPRKTKKAVAQGTLPFKVTTVNPAGIL